MVIYGCERCGKEFNRKTHYDTHKRRKKPCVDKMKTPIQAPKQKLADISLKQLVINNEPETDPQMTEDSTIPEIKYVDLFCGLGAFHTAFDRHNKFQQEKKYTCVFASDIDEGVRNIYQENYGLEPQGDIHEINIETLPDFEILCAGFPCFVAGTHVLTNHGYKRIEDVSLKDTLMTHTGKFQKIINLQTKEYHGYLYRIQTQFHSTIQCTREHPFYTRERTRAWNNQLGKYEYIFSEPQWKPSFKLATNDYLGMKINDRSEIPELYLDNRAICFRTGLLVGQEYMVKNISDKKEIVIPEWLQNAPINLIQEFVNGYQTSDKVILNQNELIISSLSYTLALGLQRLYLKLGHILSIKKIAFPKNKISNDGQVSYQLYGSISKRRHCESSFIDDQGYVWYPVDKIAHGDLVTETVFNFEVEEDNSYIVENIIAHNCQPFSIAGKQEGFHDKVKGNLFYKILDIIDVKRPKTLILENVKNLYTIHKGQTFKIIKKELEERGYQVAHKVIDSRYYNCPQSRHRIYIVGNQDKNYQFRDVNNPIVPVSSIIDPLITDYFDYQSKYKLEKTDGKSMMKYKLINRDTGKGGRQGERVYDITKCGPTICASSGGPGAKTGLYEINGHIRTLSVSETLQMFGFETSFKFKTLSRKKYMLFYLGNSIVVNVLEELIKDL